MHEEGRECENDRDSAGNLVFHTIGRYTYEGCPQRLVTREVVDAVIMWSRTKRYGLPYQGSWMEQPYNIMEILDALDTEDMAMQELARERRERGDQR